MAMASLPRLPRDLSAPPPRPGRAGHTELRSRSHDAKRLPVVAQGKGKDAQGPKATPRRAEPKVPSKLRPHPAFQVIQAADEQLEAALRARPVRGLRSHRLHRRHRRHRHGGSPPRAPPEAQHGILLLEFFGITAQEVLSTYHVQIAEVPGLPGKVEAKAERIAGRQGSKSSTPRTPREDVKAKPLVKRSGSVASTMSEASEGDDGWVTATCWAVLGRRDATTGLTCSAILAVALPNEARSIIATSRRCRLQYKSHDWVKWGLAVRKDPASWLGQISMPVLLGLEKPVLMCSVERSGPEGSSPKLILYWSVREDSNKFLLRAGSVLWQYRWRWCNMLSQWNLGSIKKTSPVEWGNYISAPLLGEWSAGTSGTLEVSLRYSANPQASLEAATLNLASCDWSEWSDSTGPVVLGISPPEPGDQMIEVSLDPSDPCRASIRWHSFVAEPHYRLEYRVQLRGEVSQFGLWDLVAWKEAAADLQQDFTQILGNLMPRRSYVVRVQARYAGGDGLGGGWSADLSRSFQTPAAWRPRPGDGATLPAPQLVPEPAAVSSRSTQVTRRFVLLPDDDVELEWAVPGQRWEKLSFTAADGIASFDVVKLQYRLGKNADALIRWTSHGKAGEIAWISTGMEVPCLGRVELRADGAAELSFDPVSGTEVASCFQIRCEEPNGEVVDFPPVAIQGREEIKFLVGPTKLAQLTGRSFRVRLRGADTSSWSPWSPVHTAISPPLAGPRPNSLRASAYVATTGQGSQDFQEMVAATSKGTTMKLSWEGFAASDSNPIGYHLKLKPKLQETCSPEVFWDAAACTISTHLGLQQCEMVLRQLMPNTEYIAMLRADGRADDKAFLSTTFRTGEWTSSSLRPLMPPQLAKNDGRNISFQKSHLSLDPRMSVKGPKNLRIYELQWRPLEGRWRSVRSLQLIEEDMKTLEADWHMACDFRNDGHVPNRLQLRMALQDPVAKVLLPERLWFSEAIVMTSGFEQPEAISPRLTWSKELLVELAFPSKWTQDCMAENHITQCQVRFQNGLNGEIFCSEASLVSALYHVDRRSSVTWFLPLISLPFSGNCHYVASLRLGNEHVWSDWSDFGSSMATAMPKVWSKDQLLATKPLNCKVKLDWQQLCCDLGPIPVECVISMAMMQEGHESQQGQERLVAMTNCTAQSQKMAMPSLRDRLEVAINGFDPGVTYRFTLYARAHLPILGGGSERSDAESLSKLDFQEVARSEPFQWPSRLSEEWSCTVDWSLPFPRQVLLPDDGELEDSSRRWQGRAVLLAWPHLEGLQLEVREESQHTHQVFGWQSCQSIHIRLAATDYMAACDLPSDLVRFRWRTAAAAAAGPSSDVCVAKVATPQVSAELGPGLRVRLKATVPRDAEVSMVTFLRIRYKVPGGAWKILAPRSLGTSKVNNFTTEVAEEHGLEVGKSYVFSMQFLAPKRRSQWSSESSPITLQVPQLPVLDALSQLVISAKCATSVTVSWPLLSTDSLEFRLDLHQILENEEQHRTSILVEVEGEAAPSEAKVFNLWPATEYSAELFLRCVQAGVRRWHPTGLKSRFITPDG